ncbi:MAG: hypothetical protein P1P93_00615 [Gammaproteobacteria bacterium]|nr:hypothetical protein [Gammaproteobacteria bacterium]
MNLSNILPFGKSTELLVCETDGFSLRGSVLSRAGNTITASYHASVQTTDMAEAVVELVGQLKASGWQGGNAVLLSPAVLSTLIELPINPKKPRPIAQMMELIRWEAEPLLIQHTTRWSVGHLLVGQGYMTAEQAEAIIDLQQGKANEAGGLALAEKFSFRRFGDLAEELGYIRRSQLNACLAGQEWLKSDDELVECGWSPQGEVADVPGMFNWLVSCVNQGLLQRWIDVFAKQGVVLEAMYPLIGCSASLIADNKTNDVLIEVSSQMAFAMTITAGKITAQQWYDNNDKEPYEAVLESYHGLNPPLDVPVWLASSVALPNNLLADVNDALEADVIALDMLPISENISAGMVGAARQFWKLSGTDRGAGVRLGGPLPPPLQRLEIRAVMLVATLLLLIAMSEAWLMMERNLVEKDKAVIDARWQTIDTSIKQINTKTAEIDKLKKEVAEREVAQVRMKALVAFYNQAIPERKSLIKGILGIIQSATPDDVIINSIDELGKRVPVRTAPVTPNSQQDKRVEVENFNVEAWALSEISAQRFLQIMEEALEPWGMEVRDSVVQAGVGPLNLNGFTLGFRMVKLLEPESLTSNGSKK